MLSAAIWWPLNVMQGRQQQIWLLIGPSAPNLQWKKMSVGVCCGHGLLKEGLWIWRSFSLIHPVPCFDPQEETSHSSTFEAPEQSLQESFGSFDQDSFYLWLAANVEVVQSATAQFCSIMIHNIDSSGDASWSPLDPQGWPWVLLHCTFIMSHVYCCSSMHVNLSSYALMYINNVTFVS